MAKPGMEGSALEPACLEMEGNLQQLKMLHRRPGYDFRHFPRWKFQMFASLSDLNEGQQCPQSGERRCYDQSLLSRYPVHSSTPNASVGPHALVPQRSRSWNRCCCAMKFACDHFYWPSCRSLLERALLRSMVVAGWVAYEDSAQDAVPDKTARRMDMGRYTVSNSGHSVEEEE